MCFQDDELVDFEAKGAPALPVTGAGGSVRSQGVDIWYASYGSGPPVVLLHGGLGNSRNWGYQIPALLGNGNQVILVDSRGHGRSTRDQRPYSYELMASDVLAVLDALAIEKATLVGWSDGACIALIVGDQQAARVNGVLFFACNMDPSGTKLFEPSPVIDRCLSRHRKDYAELSATPNDFDDFFAAVGTMHRTQPNYSREGLSAIRIPVLFLHAELDEFIRQEHMQYLADNIPDAQFQIMPGVSHFAPVQRPEVFNQALVEFVRSVV